jgi:ABC-type sugar transport system permease subunit
MFQTTGILSVVTNGLFGITIPWLTSTDIAPYGIIMVQVWKFTGYYMVIYIAGLLDIPQSLYESARIDGANYVQQFRFITIPMLRNTFTLAIVTCVIFTFGAFPLQYVITEGGPSRSTEVLGLLIYLQAFRFNKFGYASAISVLFFGTLFLVSFFQLKLFKPGNEV